MALPTIEVCLSPSLFHFALIGGVLCSACADTDPAAESCSEDQLCTYAGTGEAGFDGDGHPLSESLLYWVRTLMR